MTPVSSHDDAVVSIRNVTKMFGDVTAVDNVSLDIQRNPVRFRIEFPLPAA